MHQIQARSGFKPKTQQPHVKRRNCKFNNRINQLRQKEGLVSSIDSTYLKTIGIADQKEENQCYAEKILSIIVPFIRNGNDDI